MKNDINDLVAKELSRKEFLQFIGGGIVVLFGMSNFINYLLRFNRTGTPSVITDSRHGFGSRKFGA